MATTLFPSILPETSQRDQGTVDESAFDDECPFCDDYNGEHVKRHARSAHPAEYERVMAEQED